MKRHVAATLLVLTTLGVLKAHVDVEAEDGRYFGIWQGRKHDVIGWWDEQRNRLGRDCRQVQRPDLSGPVAADVLALIREHSPPDSRQAQLVSLQQHGSWLLAELTFARLNPAVVLLRAEEADLLGAKGLHLPERAIWSGSTAPWLPGPRIRMHLRAQAPQVPEPLLACYEPASPDLH